jgi:hypothetical protein
MPNHITEELEGLEVKLATASRIDLKNIFFDYRKVSNCGSFFLFSNL